MRPLVASVEFSCTPAARACACGSRTVYDPPSSCATDKCRSRNYTVERSTARTIDTQTIKVQELETEFDDPGRVPRTARVELEALINSAAPGQVVTVVGVVQRDTAAAAAAAGGGRDQRANSVFDLILDANTVVTAEKGTLLEQAYETVGIARITARRRRGRQRPGWRWPRADAGRREHVSQAGCSLRRPCLTSWCTHSAPPSSGTTSSRRAYCSLYSAVPRAFPGQGVASEGAGVCAADASADPGADNGADSYASTADRMACRPDPHVLVVGDPG